MYLIGFLASNFWVFRLLVNVCNLLLIAVIEKFNLRCNRLGDLAMWVIGLSPGSAVRENLNGTTETGVWEWCRACDGQSRYG